MKMKERFEEYMDSNFWTRLDEMVEDIEEYGYSVPEANEEYIVIVDNENEEEEMILYLGHTSATMWVERVRSI